MPSSFSVRLVVAGVALALTAHAQTYSISQFHIAGSSRAPNIAADPEGNVIYADASASTIVRVSPTGVGTILAGATNQRGDADGPGSTARFNNPGAIAADVAGNLYVVDAGNFTVRKISPAGVVTTLAGRAGMSGYIDGVEGAARFNVPGSIACAPSGEVYLSDYDPSRGGASIRKISPAGVVTTLARSPAADSTEPAGSFSVAGLAVNDAGDVFFADPAGNTIRRVTSGGAVTVFAGAYNRRGSLDGMGAGASFSAPDALTFEPNGDLLVADASGRTLRRISPEGAVSTIAGQPYPDVYSVLVDGVGGAALLWSTIAMGCDRTGNVFLLSTEQWLGPNMIRSVLRKGIPTSLPSRPILTQSPARDHPEANYNSRNVGARASVTFAAAAAANMTVSFQWTRNGVSIPGATQANFVIPSASSSDEGEYAVRLTSAGGQMSSASVTLRVFSPAFEAFTSRRAVQGGSFLWGITSGAGQLVAVGTGGKILTSSDGREWTARDSGTAEWLVGVAYGAGRFVVVGDHGVILVSTNAITWRPAAVSATTQRLNNVVYGLDRFIAVGEAGTIVTSVDGQTWTRQASPATGWLRGLAYVPPGAISTPSVSYPNTSGFYASGERGEVLKGNGFVWNREVTVNTLDIETLSDGPIGIGQDGVIVAQTATPSYTVYSKTPGPDGRGVPYQTPSMVWWIRTELGLAARFRGLARGGGAIFATGENGVIAAAQSVHGPWSFIPSGTTANLVNGVFHGNSLFVVGENETILQSQPLYRSRLINIATRGVAGGDTGPMISGFVVSGTRPKTVLVRAAGPALRDFGVTGALGAPVLTLFDDTSQPIATNRGWANAPAIAEAAARLGAFPFAAGSADAALLLTLEPGAYTAHVASTNDASGVALLEAYDAEPLASEGSRAINISTRGHVGAGANRLIAGFVINGAASRRVLIRAVGPTLAAFGVQDGLAAPKLELIDSRGTRLRRAEAWSAEADASDVEGAALVAGAFALDADSKDAAIVATLLPGNYTVQVSGVNNTTGPALVEVYDLP